MEVKSAVQLANSSILKPGWTIEAEDFTDRFEGAIRITLRYPAYRFNRDDAPNGYPVEIQAEARFPLVAAQFPDDISLYKKLVQTCLQIEEHEWREAFRVLPSYWAPFHPHRCDGMERWGTPDADLKFGVC